MINGLTDIVIGARSREPWLRLARDLMGFEVRAEGTDDAHIGEGARATLFAAPGVETGRLRVLEFPDAPPRERPSSGELGYFDFDLYTKDMGAFHRATLDAGYQWNAEPGAWSIPGTPVSLTQGLLQADDGVNIVPVEGTSHASWLKAWALDPERPFSEVSSAIAMVPNIDESLRFWIDGMGMAPAGDFQLQHPYLDVMLGLPPGTTFRMAIVSSPGSTARVELIQMPGDQLDRSNDSQPGASGIIAWGFRSDDLDTDFNRVIGSGGKLERSVTEVDDAIHGKATVATARTLDNNLIELWQPA